MKSLQSSSINNIFHENNPDMNIFRSTLIEDDRFPDIEELLKDKSHIQENLSSNSLELKNELGFQEKFANNFKNDKDDILMQENESCISYSEERKKLSSKKIFVIETKDIEKSRQDEKKQKELRKKMGVSKEVSIIPLTPPPQKDEKFYKYIFEKNYSIKQQPQKEPGTKNENLQFNFDSMKIKNNQKQSAIEISKKPSDFFQNIFHTTKNQTQQQEKNGKTLIKNPQTLAPFHIDLNKISVKPNLNINYYPLSSKRRSFKRKELVSKCTTGLRRQSLIDSGILVEKKVTPTKKTTFVNLSKLLQQSPSFGNKQLNLMDVVQESMRFLGKDIAPNPNASGPKKNLEDHEILIDENLNLAKRCSDVFEKSNYVTPTKIKRPLKMDKLNSHNKTNKPKIGCKCSKIQCTRLHCLCFRENKYCGPHCGCVGCLNIEEYADTIKKIKNFTQEVNPLAFKSKIENLNLNSAVKIHNRGCSCTKNNCLKNYCECHKNGLKCSSLCKCNQCENDKVKLSLDQVNKTHKKCSRKKKKFIISNDKNIIHFKSVDF